MRRQQSYAGIIIAVVGSVAGALLKSEATLHHVVKVSPTADKQKRITNTRSHSMQADQHPSTVAGNSTQTVTAAEISTSCDSISITKQIMIQGRLEIIRRMQVTNTTRFM